MSGGSAILAQSEETDVIVKRGLKDISGENVARLPCECLSVAFTIALFPTELGIWFLFNDPFQSGIDLS